MWARALQLPPHTQGELLPPTSYGSKPPSPNCPLCSRRTRATCSSVSRTSCPVIRSCTVRLGGGGARQSQARSPPPPPGPAPSLRTSNQGCPSCPETGPARHGSAGACRCACRPGHSPRGGSHRTTPGAHCPPCSGCPGAAGQRVSIRHPPCPLLPSSSPRVTGKGGGNQREQRDGPRGWWDGTRAPRHMPSPWGVTWHDGQCCPPPTTGPQRRRSCTFTFSTEVVPTPEPPPWIPWPGLWAATDKGDLIAHGLPPLVGALSENG